MPGAATLHRTAAAPSFRVRYSVRTGSALVQPIVRDSSSKGSDHMATQTNLGGTFTFPGTSLTVNRIGYGAMQLAGKGVWGPPADEGSAIAVLREAGALGVTPIAPSDSSGPHVTNQLIRRALPPYPDGLVMVTKVGARRPADQSWQPA